MTDAPAPPAHDDNSAAVWSGVAGATPSTETTETEIDAVAGETNARWRLPELVSTGV